MRHLPIFLILIIISSCSGNSVHILKKSDNNLFTSINPNERDRLKRAAYYRQLRQKDWEQYKKKQKSKEPVTEQELSSNEEQYYHQVPTTKPTPAPSPGWEDHETRVRVEQQLIYFCMKHRNHPHFKNYDNICKEFTEDALSSCKQKHFETPSISFIHCIDKGLTFE